MNGADSTRRPGAAAAAVDPAVRPIDQAAGMTGRACRQSSSSSPCSRSRRRSLTRRRHSA